MMRMANSLVESGAATQQELRELGQQIARGGMHKKVAIGVIDELIKSSGDYVQRIKKEDDGEPARGGLKPISRNEFTKEKLKAVSEGDFAKVENLNKRARITMERNPQLWRG